MNIRLTLVNQNGDTQQRDLNTLSAADVSMERLESMTLPFTRDDIRGVEFDGTELTLTLDSGALVISDFINEFGEIKEIYTVNGQLLFKDASDLISQLSAPAAGNVAADGTTSVFNLDDQPTPILDGDGLGYRDLRGGLNDPDIGLTDLNGDPDNPLEGGAPDAVDDLLVLNSESFGDEQSLPGGNLLSNDSDPNGDALVVSAVNGVPLTGGSVVITLPSGIQVEVNDDGSYQILNPEIYLNQEVSDDISDTFTYTVTDGLFDDTASVTINFIGDNDAPIAQNDSAETDEDTGININVLANDSDPDGDALTVTSASAGNGSVVIEDDGTLTYTPNGDYNGTDTITYTISDGNGGTDSASVTVTVNPVNDDPVALDDTAQTDEDTDVNINVLANDSDPEGDTLTVISATAGNGSVVIEDDGTLTYTPDANFNGSDTITYTISDGNGGTDSASVAVTVTPVNDPPVAVDDAVDTTEDVVFSSTVDLDENDIDVDGDSLTVVAGTYTTDQGGSISINTDGSYTYTPAPNFNGEDRVDYTVTDGLLSDTGTLTINVASVNDAPVAVDDNASTDQDTVLNSSVDLDNNDFDVDGDDLTVTAGTFNTTAGGSIVISSDGSYTYTPPLGFSGTDTVEYTVSDGSLSDTGQLNIVVLAAEVNSPPIAVDDTAQTPEDTVLNSTVELDANDFDANNDVLTVTAETKSTSEGGSITINADGSYTYTPKENFHGTDTVEYTVSDGQFSDTGTLTITVTPVNDPPVAVDDQVNTTEDVVFNSSIDLDANDTDIDGDPLSVIPGTFETSQGGVIVISSDGSYTYTPPKDFNGTDTVGYTVSDGQLTDDGMLTLIVGAVNDAPVAVDDNVTAVEDTAFTSTVDLDANDTDVDNDPLTVVAGTFQTAQGGTIVIQSDGSYVYNPAANFNGTDTVDYTVLDGPQGAPGTLSDIGTLTIQVTPVQDAPVAVDDTGAVNEDATLSVNATNGVLSNDIEVDGESLTVIEVRTGSESDASGTDVASPGTELVGRYGTLTLNDDGSYTYVADQERADLLADGVSDTDTFTYTIVDDYGDTDEAELVITVTGVADGGCPVLHPGNDGEVFVFSGNGSLNPIVGTDGFDILIVNDTSLNISEKPNTFFDLERIHLCGRNNNFTNQELQKISAQDIFDITDEDNVLLVTGDGPTGGNGAVNAGDSVDLDLNIWTLQAGTEIIDGMEFETYQATYNDGTDDYQVTLKVETELNVI